MTRGSCIARLFLVAVVFMAATACAQDFMVISPMPNGPAASRLLEDSWPAPHAGFGLVAQRSDWWGVPGLTTRALALHAAWRSCRMACGVSQTGLAEVGWTTGAIAWGVASPHAGAAVRASVRTDRLAAWTPSRVVSREATAEVGGGAWVRTGRAITIRVSAPQLVQRGTAPLSRSLGCEVRYGDAHALWLALRAPRGGRDGERACGAALAIAPCVLWGELRDAPLRASTGVAFAWRRATCELRLDEHPVLGEAVHVSLAWSREGASR